MKRFHVHVAVTDLDQSIRFYSNLFASEPTVVKPDYAKWMLADPRINFAISKRGDTSGVNHLGMQVDSDAELAEVHARLQGAEGSIVAEKDIACCYARSDKYWITDPQGVAWETFHSLGTVPFYGQSETGSGHGTTVCSTDTNSESAMPKVAATTCCTPKAAAGANKACC